ncbi:MAG: RagB/SusD family nutrient uptake outer membrane protein, partial [Bacteroidota bacterium]
MKMIKYLSLIFFLFFLAMVSCQEDPLEEKVVSEVTADYYEGEDGLESAVNAAYSRLRNYYGDHGGIYMTVFGTDEYTHGGHGGEHFMDKYTLGLNSEAWLMWHNWSNFYEAINTCNTVIDRGEGVDMSKEKKAQLLAEARFLRAHY